MENSSDSSVDNRRDRSRSEERPLTGKLFITNIDGKVPLKLVRVNSQTSKTNSEGSSKNTELLIAWSPRETGILNTVLLLLT